MEIHAHVPHPGKTAVHWIVESLLILVSVGVGFAAAEFREYRQNRELAATVLHGMREEVESNLAVLDPLLAKHRLWQQSLAGVDLSANTKAAFDILFESRPDPDVNIGVPLRRVAWDTAVSAGALKLLDYEVAAALSEIYGYQDVMSNNHNRIASAVLYTPATFDPASRAASVRLMWGVMAEIAGNELYLRDLYQKHLPLLKRVSPH
jgi:hypothetical protein